MIKQLAWSGTRLLRKAMEYEARAVKAERGNQPSVYSSTRPM